nr:receptor-like protein 12 [Quercus suber]
MKSLEHLNLANCNLIGSISTSLGNLTKLTILDLSYNSFSGLLPLSLYNLPNLSSLYLDNNQLVGPLPNHENINFFHGPQRHKTPFFAKLLGIVAVEVIVRFQAVASNVSKHISNLYALEQIKTSTANTKTILQLHCVNHIDMETSNLTYKSSNINRRIETM